MVLQAEPYGVIAVKSDSSRIMVGLSMKHIIGADHRIRADPRLNRRWTQFRIEKIRAYKGRV